jgi:hypothetical protein
MSNEHARPFQPVECDAHLEPESIGFIDGLTDPVPGQWQPADISAQ